MVQMVITNKNTPFFKKLRKDEEEEEDDRDTQARTEQAPMFYKAHNEMKAHKVYRDRATLCPLPKLQMVCRRVWTVNNKLFGSISFFFFFLIGNGKVKFSFKTQGILEIRSGIIW